MTNLFRQSCLLFVLTFSILIAFAAIVQNVWEDYYITLQASKNLALGHGLVYTPGERVHSFTSPLGTLIPALLVAGIGPNHDDQVLWSFRIISSAAFALAVVLVLHIGHQFGWQRSSSLLVAILVMLDAKSVVFSTNGMETGFYLLAITSNLYAFIVPTQRRWAWLGSTWAAIQWIRPDGFLIAIAIALGMTLFQIPWREGTQTRHFWRHVAAGLALGTVLYLPWFIGAWIYYGSPIPNTILAKTGMYNHSWLDQSRIWLGTFFHDILRNPFAPPYAGLAPSGPSNNLVETGWNGLQFLPAFVTVSALIWMIPFSRVGRPARALSFAFLLAHGYVAGVIAFPYPWYWPPVSLLGFLAMGGLLDSLCRPVSTPVGQLIFRQVASMMVLLQLVLLLLVGVQLYHQSRQIELTHRKAIGLYIREHARSTDETVFLECLGHIGYFSQVRPLDFPGLASPRVVEMRRRLKSNNYIDLIIALKPDWVVLRPHELAIANMQVPGFLENEYQMARVFDQSEKLSRIDAELKLTGLPGIGFLRFDQAFYLLQKKRTN